MGTSIDINCDERPSCFYIVASCHVGLLSGEGGGGVEDKGLLLELFSEKHFLH